MNIVFPPAVGTGKAERLIPKRNVLNAWPSKQQMLHTQMPLGGDAFVKRAKPGATLKFRGFSTPDNQLIARFNQPFRQVIQNAHNEALETGSKELTAEHLIWSMINTLDEAANWHMPQTRKARSGIHEKQLQAKQLAEALMPDSGLEPSEVAKLFAPLAEQLHGGKMRGDIPIEDSLIKIQATLRAAMTEALDADDPVKQLTSKILWSDPESGAFYSLAQAAQKLAESQKPLSDSDTNMDMESVEPMGLYDALQIKSPVLSKWVQAASGKEAQSFHEVFKPAPLPVIVSKGVEMALRELNTNRKQQRGGRYPQTNQNKNLESLNAIIPSIQRKNVDKAHLSMVLNNALKKLQTLPNPGSEMELTTATLNTRKLFEAFLLDSSREDFSLGAFVQQLKDNTVDEEAVDLPEDHVAVGRILSEIIEEAQDKRLENMDQFERACPTLMKNGTNLVRAGMKGQLPDVLMRREAIDRMLAMINSGGSRTNVMLNTASGEGKTFAVLGLAQRIADNDVPKNLQGTQLIQLDMGALVAGTGLRGDLEQKAKTMFSELSNYLDQNGDRKVIVFMDEIHMLGGEEGKTLVDIMKSSGILEKKNLTFIGATTPEDWRKGTLRSDQAFQGRFHDVSLPGFSKDEKLAILGWNAMKMEKKSGIEIPPELLEKILVQASAKWPENSLRHAIDVLGLATSLAMGTPLETSILKDRLQQKELWLQALQSKKTMSGRFVRQMEQTMQEVEVLTQQLHSMNSGGSDSGSMVKDKHVKQAMAILTGEKIGVLSQDELLKLRNAKEILSQYIVGQPEALSSIEEGLREIAVRQKTGGVRNRPILSMLLPGPTGVGKTEVAKVIAKEFMGGNFIRLDMSDFMEKHDVSRLTGAAPGYIGYENGGLVDQVRKNPNSVIVFDEIEKAHPDIFNVLLQILEEGELRDNQGQPVSFRNAVIALTSNLNNEQVTELIREHRRRRESSMEPVDPQLANRELETQVRQLLTAKPSEGRPGFRPEHLGRIDYVIPFSPLTKSNVSDIVDIRLREMNQEPFLKDNNLEVVLSSSARERLVALTSASGTPSSLTDGFVRVGRSPSRSHSDSEEEISLQSGARDVRANFERFVYKKVFTDLTFELPDLENAKIVVDYDTSSQSFKLKPESVPVIKKKPVVGSTSALHQGKQKQKFTLFA
jgi:ATP-dependent Clp protease ATP-binding subunit ClpA